MNWHAWLFNGCFLKFRGKFRLGPPSGFSKITQKVLVWVCSDFLTFLTNTYAPSTLDIITAAWVLRHTELQSKSIFRLTSGHWILKFYSSLESLKQKEVDCTIFAKKFCIDFCTDAFEENLQISSFPWIQIYFSKVLHFFFAYLNSPCQGLLKNATFIIFRTLFVFAHFCAY